MKNFNRHDSHGHHGSKRHELAQHAHSHGSQAFTHTLTSTQLQPLGAKRQLSYYFSVHAGIFGDWQTSSNAEHPHDADDGGVDGDDVGPHLLQDDAHDGEDDDEDVQLVPAVADVAQEAQGHDLHDGLQDEHAGEEVVEDLQRKLQLLHAEKQLSCNWYYHTRFGGNICSRGD